MGTEPTTLPDYADEALQLMERLQGLAQITDGLGAASETLIIASNVLDETNRQIGSLNASASTAVAAIDRLQPDQLREWIESGFTSLRMTVAASDDRGQADLRNIDSAIQTIGRQTAADLESMEMEFKEQSAEIVERLNVLRAMTASVARELGLEMAKRFDDLRLQSSEGTAATQTLLANRYDELSRQAAERHTAATTGVADAAVRVLNAVEQTQQRLAAQQAAGEQAFAAIGQEQAALAAALTTLRQRQQALVEQAQAIAAVVDAVKTTADATRQTAADIEAQTSERLPALAAELHGLRTQFVSDARAVARRQTAFFVATILLLAVASYVVIWVIRGAL